MNIFVFSSIMVFILNLLLGIFLIWKGKNKRINVVWGLFCLSTMIWGLAGLGFSATFPKKIVFLSWQIGYICGILTPVLFFQFVNDFLRLNKKSVLLCGYTLAVALLTLDIFAPRLFFGDIRIVFGQFYWVDWNKYHSLI